jgi:tricorn protease
LPGGGRRGIMRFCPSGAGHRVGSPTRTAEAAVTRSARRTVPCIVLVLCVGPAAAAQPGSPPPAPPPAAAPTLLLRQPTISERHIAFMYGNDIWVVDRRGGEARRVTSFPGQETDPHLSPDGRWLAFSAQYGGNTDVWVVPVEGGEPRRLTWHPGADHVRGWTPDSRRVVFSSARNSPPQGATRFYTVSVDGDYPQALPMPRAHQGSHSPDGRRFAYRMVQPWEDEWRNYRGGQNRPVWILDLASHELEEVGPWDGSNDGFPVWIGETVFFLSDRDWAMNVWAYDTRTRALRQVTRHADFDVKGLNAGAGVLVYEHAGRIRSLDPATGESQLVDIRVRGDFPWLMPQWRDVAAQQLANPSISPTGRRVAFEARGEILSVPAEKGDWRNLTRTSDVADRRPFWSPDGTRLAWFSDDGGEYGLVIAAQDGLGERRRIPLESGTFYYTPVWSPDGARIAFTDTGLNLWVLDVATGRQTRIDTDRYMVPERSVDPVWSPDSKWLAYAKRLDTQLRAIHVWSVATGASRQVTDGMADAYAPAWDASGKYLWFLASTNFGLNTGWLEMSSYERPVARGLYLAVLSATEPSPLLPQSDEEGAANAAGGAPAGAARHGGGAGGAAPPPAVRIDFDGLDRRIVATAVPLRTYGGLAAGPEGTVFFLENVPNQQGLTLHRYQLKDRESVAFLTGVNLFRISADGKKLLYRGGQTWGIVDTDRAPPRVGDGRIETGNLRVHVDPRAEFRQMFDDGWRFQRDFLYVPNLHGADWNAVYRQYRPFVDHVAHRSDLTWLLDWMGAEVAIGHSFVQGGDAPSVPGANVGLLGADFDVRDGRYRIARIYDGESWNPDLRAPLAVPGIDVSVGDYLLEVNGAPLLAPDNPYRLLENTADRQTFLRVGPRPDGTGSRVVTVVPVASDAGLRQRAWVEDNRRRVDELSGGRLAYVWLPNTAQGGYTYFNRYFFAQMDRPGVIIDERFNQGGSAADYIVDVLAREKHGYFNNPVGDRRPFTTPMAGIWGPKVMVINEMAGSGGDLLPYMFRRMGLGPLVGTRTWGGLVGTWDTPPLVDGGVMIAPRGGFFNLQGAWEVEDEGVAPDIHVEMTPKEVIAGGDPQLERAVQEALRLLEQNPVVLRPEPPPPVRARRPAR